MTRPRARLVIPRPSVALPSIIPTVLQRGNRVWSLSEVNSFKDRTDKGARNVVLKDVWLDRNARTERDIRSATLNDVEAFSQQLHLSDSSRKLEPLPELRAK